jgi:hypothetical protein
MGTLSMESPSPGCFFIKAFMVMARPHLKGYRAISIGVGFHCPYI